VEILPLDEGQHQALPLICTWPKVAHQLYALIWRVELEYDLCFGLLGDGKAQIEVDGYGLLFVFLQKFQLIGIQVEIGELSLHKEGVGNEVLDV